MLELLAMESWDFWDVQRKAEQGLVLYILNGYCPRLRILQGNHLPSLDLCRCSFNSCCGQKVQAS